MTTELKPALKTLMEMIADSLNEYAAHENYSEQAVVDVEAALLNCAIVTIFKATESEMGRALALRLLSDRFYHMCKSAAVENYEILDTKCREADARQRKPRR